MTTPRRRGVTLVELLVVIALLGVIAGLTTVSLRAPRAVPPAAAAERLAAARRQAVLLGQPVELIIDDTTGPHAVRALPDGRVLTDGWTPPVSSDNERFDDATR